MDKLLLKRCMLAIAVLSVIGISSCNKDFEDSDIPRDIVMDVTPKK